MDEVAVGESPAVRRGAVPGGERRGSGGYGRAEPRLRLARTLLVVGTAAICLLQVLALPVRNPFTRTMSSYEYTWAGALFPLGLAVFGAGLVLLGRQVPARHRVARLALFGAALGSGATAVFPSGTGRRGEALWPGEVHRWGSIALVVGALSGALLLARATLPRRSRRTIGLLTLSGLVAGVLFLTGQLASAPPGVLGYAPLAGGLSQRILVGITAAAMLLLTGHGASLVSSSAAPGHLGNPPGSPSLPTAPPARLVGRRAPVTTKRPTHPADVVRTGHGHAALDRSADPSPVQA